MRDRLNKSYKASFTIEATIVMAIILMCVVTMIMFAYRCRDSVFRNYVMSESAHKTAHMEETWKPHISNTDGIKQYSEDRLHTIGRYSGKSILLSRDEFMNTASAEFDEVMINARFGDVENYMRLASVIRDFKDARKADSDD